MDNTKPTAANFTGQYANASGATMASGIAVANPAIPQLQAQYNAFRTAYENLCHGYLNNNHLYGTSSNMGDMQTVLNGLYTTGTELNKLVAGSPYITCFSAPQGFAGVNVSGLGMGNRAFYTVTSFG